MADPKADTATKKTAKAVTSAKAPVTARAKRASASSLAPRGSSAWLQAFDEDGPAWQPSRRADFLVGVLGNKCIANLLGVTESQPSRWRHAQEVPGPRVAPVLVDLDHVVGRLLLVWDRSVVGDWLTGSNAFLDGARPIDVLMTRGSADVLEAIEAETAGAYA